MTVLLQPNLRRADDLVLAALQRRHGPGATFQDRSTGPALRLEELVPDDAAVYSALPNTSHYGKTTRRLSRLVYELNVYVHVGGAPRPRGLHEKFVYVVDVVHPPSSDARTGFLAVKLDGPPLLMPLPELPASLTHGEGTVADTRVAVRTFAIRMADLVNLALPAVRALSGATPLEDDIAYMLSNLEQ